MTKRPPFLVDNEEKLGDAEEPHKTHHHPPKGHASRHHKKHDKSTTTAVKISSTTPSYEKVSVTEGKADRYSTTPGEISTAEVVTAETPTVTTVLSTVKPTKKQPRRQKTKETSTNRTEIEDDKPQRRRKTHHHHRNKNNTLLTNSIHDEILHSVNNGSSDATLPTRDFTTTEAHSYSYKFTTVPTTEETTGQGEIASKNNMFTEDRTTESITEPGTTVTIVASTRTTEGPRSDLTITRSTSPDRSGNTYVTIPTTTSPVKRYSKAQKNKTGILGPARIDVTILETPEKKHKPGKIERIKMFVRFRSISIIKEICRYYVIFFFNTAVTASNSGRSPTNSQVEARPACYCEEAKKDEKELAREERRRLKEERLRKKERKLKKKAKLEKECLTEKMNCFEHDNDHWRTAPLWSAGPFCFCMNANNNTYSCVRTINATHNFLYCEFTTGLVTFYNLRLGEYANEILGKGERKVK